MTPTYHIVGSDGQVYGPVSLEDLKSWIHEGRLTPETQVHRSDQTQWQPSASFAELALGPTPVPEPPQASPSPTPVRVVTTAPVAVPATAPSTLPAVAPATLQALAQQAKAGAGWFYWIAGLSVVNTVSHLAGSSWGFIMALGITQVLDAFAQKLGGAGTAVALGLNVAILGVIVLFGWLANKRYVWAFVVGMVIYGLDGLLFLLLGDWLALGFHALALYFMFKGLQACRLYHRLAGTPS